MLDDARGGAPNDAISDAVLGKGIRPAENDTLASISVIARIDERGQGDLEDFLHLAGIGPEGCGLPKPPHHRGDDEPDGRGNVIKGAQQLDQGGIDADLFLGFAERSLHRMGLVRMAVTSGKRDLPGVGRQLMRAKDEGDREGIVPLDHRNQDSGILEPRDLEPLRLSVSERLA